MYKTSTKKGFTLIEMIISIAIFTIVALVAVGALVRIMDANKKAIDLKTAINNINFTLESMTREMRVGSKYICNGYADSCSTSGQSWVVEFTSSKKSTSFSKCNLRFAYAYSENTLWKAEQPSDSANCSESVDDVSVFTPLISPNIFISNSFVNVTGDDKNSPPKKQPKIFVHISGYTSGKERDRAEFSLQTTISQRLPQ